MPGNPSVKDSDGPLLAALGEIQRRGAIGEASLADAVAHAEQFVAALPADVHRLVDLGSGGGLPGLVIAVRRPEIAVTLVERRGNRADLLRRAVLGLGLGEHVQVFSADVRELAAIAPHAFDAVTARSFAAPSITAKWAAALLRKDGLLLVSEPPQPVSDRWPAELLTKIGLSDLGLVAGIRRFRQTGA